MKTTSRLRTIALSLLAMLAGQPNLAAAVPHVNISWDGCTGPTDKAILPGQTVSIYASVLGHDQPHRAYRVKLMMATGVGPLPDAWRFEAGGCQGSSRLTIDHLAPPEVAAVCPSFQGTLPSFQLKGYSYDAFLGIAVTHLNVAYPNGGLGNTTQVDPAQRYFLGRWKFDHSRSVAGPGTAGESCGNLEEKLCIPSLSNTDDPAWWVGVDGIQQPWAFENQFVTANDHFGCPGSHWPTPTPAQNSTWGAIKNQYR